MNGEREHKTAALAQVGERNEALEDGQQQDGASDGYSVVIRASHVSSPVHPTLKPYPPSHVTTPLDSHSRVTA
eukprot:2845675-Prymnesium_polylepis.1